MMKVLILVHLFEKTRGTIPHSDVQEAGEGKRDPVGHGGWWPYFVEQA